MTPVLTSHAGSLPRPDSLREANARRAAGEIDAAAFDEQLSAAVQQVVARQRDLGLDVVNDGEYGHAMTASQDFGAWWTYSFDRTSGLELVDPTQSPEELEAQEERLGNTPADPADGVRLTTFGRRRDWLRFRDVYGDPTSGTGIDARRPLPLPTATGPIAYAGQEAVARDTRALTAALAATGGGRGYLCALSPGSAARIGNAHYASETEWLHAWAGVLRQEYAAILDAGLELQIDDPSLAESWDQVNPEPSVADYQRFVARRIEALNLALEGLDTSRVRLHLCWGSWHGPHTTDVPLADILGEVLQANVGGLSFEAGNVRHEHEWTVWRDVEVPAGLTLLPGVVSHATNVVEHPDLVAQRIGRFAEAVGSDRVIASSDCGFGGRVHPDIAWAKLESLVAGAQRA